LVVGYIGLLQIATTSNNNILRIYTVCSSLWHTPSLVILLCPHKSSRNGTKWRTFPFLGTPELSPCLSNIRSRLTLTQQLFSQEDQSRIAYSQKSKSKSHYDRQSVGQSVLVSGAHLGPATNFSFSLSFFF
jgi:hypothetical protein